MELQELKQKSNIKVLLEGQSGRGKTQTSCEIALDVLDRGGSVLFLDTEAEGSTTLVELIDKHGYDEDIVDELEYKQVDDLATLKQQLESCSDYDLLVVDTLDHKHSYVLKSVTDAKRESDADWQEYASIYSEEKEVMELIGKPRTNIIATIDPDSGSRDKPKGAQTNIRGYFTVVLRMMRSEEEWTHKIVNWVGHGDKIGMAHPNIVQKLSEEVMERTKVEA